MLTLTPKINPTFEPWQDMLGKKMPVTAFAEFLLANRRCIVAPEPKDLISIFSQVRGGIQITREAGRGNKSINSVTVTVNIQGKTQVDYVDLPESITVNLPIFVRESCQDIELDLLVSATPETGGIYVVASSSTIELAKINAFNAMLTRLAELSGVVVSTGKPAHAPWNYLK